MKKLGSIVFAVFIILLVCLTAAFVVSVGKATNRETAACEARGGVLLGLRDRNLCVDASAVIEMTP